ncbi:MAG: hypothetical protein Q9M89_05245 [Persephonella sp.]|nr:hypothetical protein [Persephonella sp.]
MVQVCCGTVRRSSSHNTEPRTYNRGALFAGLDPVLFAGARVNYDAGVAKVYIGYNQGGGLRQGSGEA